MGTHFVTVDENGEFQQEVCAGLKYGERHVAKKFNKSLLCNPPIHHCGYDGIERLTIAKWVDLLYVDGPSNKVGDCFAICDDAVSLNIAPPKAMLFDIRRETVRYTKDFYGDRYRWDESAYMQKDAPWYLSAIRHHSIAWRRL